MAGLPLQRPYQQSCVCLDPFQVGVERLNNTCQAGLALLGGSTEHPVMGSDRLGNSSVIGLAVHDGHNSLLELHGMAELVTTHRRAQRVGTHHEHERVCTLNCLSDLGSPLGTRPDALPIDPDFATLAGQFLIKPADKVLVLTRIGDEHIAHSPPTDTARESRLTSQTSSRRPCSAD